MYDTIVLKSPYFGEDYKDRLTEKFKEGVVFKQKNSVDLSTGNLEYEMTLGKLNGSFDSRISVKIDNREYRVERSTLDILRHNNVVPKLVETDYFMTIECSLHKIVLGHNVYGFDLNLRDAIEYLFELLQESFGVKLHNYEDWQLIRLDYAEVFELSSLEACYEFFKGMQMVRFPRRDKGKNLFGRTGIYIVGSTTTLKVYHKGTEFKKHDKSRLKRYLKSSVLRKLENKADKIIRVEIEIKKRKLIYDFGKLPFISEVNDSYFKCVYDKEIEKFMQEGKNMEIARKSIDVDRRLNEIYKPNLAGILLGTWYRMTVHGEVYVKENMAKRTFLRHKKLLKEAGCSWLNTDIEIKNSLVPLDFTIRREDRRRLDINLDEAKRDLVA